MTASRQIKLFAFSFLLFTVLSKSIAWAGDYASRHVIGFSPDGRYFAFEQYGVQDGSGFPYSEIFVIDTETDNWVPESPFRIRLDKESERSDTARKSARQAASPLLQKLNIGEPGEHLASNPRAELSADPGRVVINAAHRFTPPKDEPISFTLTEKTLNSAKCAQYSERPMKGFTLTMTHEGANPVILSDDEKLPDSRGCALGYGIADIFSHESGGETTYAILLHMPTIGFEGPDRRFIAVTHRLP
jgi:predicted secreted protein